MIKAFLFDMDGTLIDTEILWVEALELCAADWGYAISHEEALDIVYGVSWDDVFKEVMRRYPEIDKHVEEMYAAMGAYHERLRNSRDIFIRPSIELLRSLAKDYPIAIVSGSYTREVAEGVEVMGIGDCIEFYMGQEHFSPGKPDPTCYLMGAERIGVAPEHCLVFEDSTMGMRAAREAGMHLVALARPGCPEQEVGLADWVLDDLSKFSVQAFEARMRK